MNRHVQILSFVCSLYPLIFICAAQETGFSRVSALPADCVHGCSLQVIDSDFAWLKSRSTLWQTRDAGARWRSVPLPPASLSAEYVRMEFINRERGLVLLGDSKRLYETSDNGGKWMNRRMPEIDGTLQDASLNSETGALWLAGGEYRYNANGDAPNYALKKYESGGRGILNPIAFSRRQGEGPWEKHEFPEGAWLIKQVKFLNGNHGIAIGDTCMYYTDSEGDRWNASMFTDPAGVSEVFPNEGMHPTFFFLNDTTGWLALDDGALYRTSNGGRSWMRITSRLRHVQQLLFLSNTYGLAIAGRAKLYESRDSGAAWREIATPFLVRSLASSDSEKVWVLSDEALLNFRAK